MKVVALIPAYNEAQTIGATIRSTATIPSLAEIVVINDGSLDNTGQIIREAMERSKIKLTLVDLSKNSGKGNALNKGKEAASADIYLLLDGDLGDTAHLAQALLEPLFSNQADLTIARFTNQQTVGKKMGFGFVRRTAAFGVKLLTGIKVDSPLSGQRAIKKEVIERVGPFFPDFGVEIGLTVGALHHGFSILEVPLAMKHRGYGRGLKGFKHRGRQFIHVLKALKECRRRGWGKLG